MAYEGVNRTDETWAGASGEVLVFKSKSALKDVLAAVECFVDQPDRVVGHPIL